MNDDTWNFHVAKQHIVTVVANAFLDLQHQYLYAIVVPWNNRAYDAFSTIERTAIDVLFLALPPNNDRHAICVCVNCSCQLYLSTVFINYINSYIHYMSIAFVNCIYQLYNSQLCLCKCLLVFVWPTGGWVAHFRWQLFLNAHHASMPLITAMKNARRACPTPQSTLQYHQMGSQRGGNPFHWAGPGLK